MKRARRTATFRLPPALLEALRALHDDDETVSVTSHVERALTVYLKRHGIEISQSLLTTVKVRRPKRTRVRR